MKRNKVLSLVIAGAVTTAVVGGTLAYFISSDHVINSFKTAKTGIKIVEVFDKTENGPHNSVKPGDEINKDVKVNNTADYAQFMRVKLTPKYTGDDISGLDISKIKLNFKSGMVTNTPTAGKWIKSGDYYYYVGKIAPGADTEYLLDSVTLDTSATDNKYQGKGYDVDVEAEGVQANHNAFTDWGITVESDLGKALKGLQ